MADNITIKDGGGTNVVLGAKDVASVYYPQSTPVTPAGVTMVGTAGSAAAGVMTIQGVTSGTPVIVGDGAGALSVDDNGGSLTVDGSVSISGTATVSIGDSWVQTDDAAFTPATGKIAMVGAEFDDAAPDSVDEGDGGAIRMSGNRNLYVRIRDNAGNERGMNIDANGDAGVTARSGAFASGSIASGALASGSIASGAIATGAIAAGAASIADNEDAGSSDGDRGVKMLVVRSNTAASTAGSDKDYQFLITNTTGHLWVDASGQTLTAGGSVAHDGVDSGNPVKVGGRARSTEIAAVASDDRTDFVTDLTGKQIVLPYANPENFVSGAITAAMTGTTTTSLLAAPAAGLRNYITTIIVSNSHATVGTDILIQDGSGGTTLMVIPAAAVFGGAVVTLPTPLRQPTTATAIFCANVTTGSNTKVSAVGYKGV